MKKIIHLIFRREFSAYEFRSIQLAIVSVRTNYFVESIKQQVGQNKNVAVHRIGVGILNFEFRFSSHSCHMVANS